MLIEASKPLLESLCPLIKSLHPLFKNFRPLIESFKLSFENRRPPFERVQPLFVEGIPAQECPDLAVVFFCAGRHCGKNALDAVEPVAATGRLAVAGGHR